MTSAHTGSIVRSVVLLKGTGRGPATRKFTRKSPQPAEQERREAWGRAWGTIGADYKRRRLAREGR